MIDSVKKVTRTQPLSKSLSDSTAKRIKEITIDQETIDFVTSISELPAPQKLDALLEKLIINVLKNKVGLTNINEPKVVELIYKLKSKLIGSPEIVVHLNKVLDNNHN